MAYWDKDNSGHNPNAPKKPTQTTPADIQRIRDAGGQPTQKQIDEALDYFDRYERDKKPLSQSGGAAMANMPGAMTLSPVYGGKPAADPAIMKSLLSNLTQGAQIGAGAGVSGISAADAVKKVSGAANSIADMVSGILGQAGGSSEDNSIEALYRRLAQEQGQYTYNGPSADAMAKAEYDPQFQILKQLQDQQKARYEAGKAETAAGYNAMVNSTMAMQKDNKANFDATGKALKDNYAAASGNTSKNFQNSANSTAQLMSNLGVLEGQQKLADDSNKALAQELGFLNSQGLAATNLNTQLGANQYANDANRANVSRQAGLNSAQELLQGFLDQSAENDMRKLQLTGDQQKAKNAYQMQIEKLLQEGRQAGSEAIQQQVESIMKGNQQQIDNNFRSQELDLRQADSRLGLERFAADQEASKQKALSALNPFDALMQRAYTATNNDNTAKQLSQIVLDVYKNNPNAQSAAQLLQAMDPAVLQQNPQLQALAYDFFNKVTAGRK